MKSPLQRHMDNLGNKTEEGGETSITKKSHMMRLKKSGLYLDILML